MQRALIRRVSGEYIDLIACDAYNYDVKQYDCTTDLHANTPYSPELVQLLNGNYSSWILILNEPSALLIGSCANGWVLAYGESANIIDWVYDVITGTSYAPIETVESVSVYQLLTDPSIGPLLNYMFGFKFLPLRSDHEELHPFQTGNGTQYWCRFLLCPSSCR